MYKKYYSDNNQYYNTIFRIEQLKLIFNVYKKHLEKQFQKINDKEIAEAIQYYNCSYVPFSELNNEESVSCYLKENVFPKKNIVDAILGFNKISKDSTNLQKILHDLDLNWLRNYEQILEVQSKILKECQKLNIEKQQAKQRIIDYYNNLLKNGVYVTETFSCFNNVAKQNLTMRLFG